MAKVIISSDFEFAFEAEEKGFDEKINRFEVLQKASEALTTEWNKYIPEEIEGPEKELPVPPKPPVGQ